MLGGYDRGVRASNGPQSPSASFIYPPDIYVSASSEQVPADVSNDNEARPAQARVLAALPWSAA